LSLSIDGGVPASHGTGEFVDNAPFETEQLTLNDGYFYLSSVFLVAVEQTVTLKAGTYNLARTSGFNPQADAGFHRDIL
jgi:hypothetical protein